MRKSTGILTAAALTAGTLGAFGLTQSAFGADPSGAVTGLAGKCVDVAGASSTDGAAVQLYDCNGTSAQNWTVGSDGSLSALGKCMDVASAGTADGSLVQLYDCNGTNAQKWTVSNGELVNAGSGKCLDATGQLLGERHPVADLDLCRNGQPAVDPAQAAAAPPRRPPAAPRPWRRTSTTAGATRRTRPRS